MRYDISKQTAPTMPTLSKGTECIKILLSQASKSIQEPLVPMFFPVLGAHISGAEFQYPDRSWKELTGIMCICNLSEATLADSREPHVQTPEAKRSYFPVVFLYKYFGFSLTYSYLCTRYADFR